MPVSCFVPPEFANIQTTTGGPSSDGVYFATVTDITPSVDRHPNFGVDAADVHLAFEDGSTVIDTINLPFDQNGERVAGLDDGAFTGRLRRINALAQSAGLDVENGYDVNDVIGATVGTEWATGDRTRGVYGRVQRYLATSVVETMKANGTVVNFDAWRDREAGRKAGNQNNAALPARPTASPARPTASPAHPAAPPARPTAPPARPAAPPPRPAASASTAQAEAKPASNRPTPRPPWPSRG